MASSLGSMPVLTACAPMSPSTASICARTKAAGTGCTFGREASGMGEAGGAREGSRLVRCSRRVRGSRGESEAAKIEEAGESGKSSSAGGGDEERGGGQGCTAWTPRVFWAVSATSAVVPNTPSASQALRSAWIPAAEAQGRSQPLAGQLCASAWQRTPAPPPESEPATVSITGAAEPATPDTSSESAARNDGRGIFRKGRNRCPTKRHSKFKEITLHRQHCLCWDSTHSRAMPGPTRSVVIGATASHAFSMGSYRPTELRRSP